MQYNPLSSFPARVDDMTFFQDASLDNIDAFNHYNLLVSQGNYDDANVYAGQQDIHGYFAGLFNMFENRIYALQTFLLGVVKENPFIYEDEEPEYAFEGNMWIGD